MTPISKMCSYVQLNSELAPSYLKMYTAISVSYYIVNTF